MPSTTKGWHPHAYVLLTMRAMDEKGKWLPKCRTVYGLDKNGERIRPLSGRWKSHKENTVDWNGQKYAEIWRQGWAGTANRYLEANRRPERIGLRSYARQGIDKIPTVRMGTAACQMVRHLKGWISDGKADYFTNMFTNFTGTNMRKYETI